MNETAPKILPCWTVYILQCADESLYTGITNNLEARLLKHASGKGARYTKGRAPYTVIFSEQHESRSSALKREYEIKTFDRTRKLKLANYLYS